MNGKLETNELTVFNQEVIPVYTTSTDEKVVMGRELYERLNIETPYSKWYPRMCEYGFTADTDYCEVSDKNVQNPQGGRPSTDHIMKLDMAKHIAMIQRTPEGFAIRQKLIELEQRVGVAIEALSPELRLLINLEVKQRDQDKALANVNRRLDETCELIALDPVSWRRDTQSLIARISEKLGGIEHIRDVHIEIYKLLESRAGVNLTRRLENKRRRMAEEGAPKSKRDKLGNLDVIAEDKKLIEVYVAIVKQMAVKYGAGGANTCAEAGA